MLKFLITLIKWAFYLVLFTLLLVWWRYEPAMTLEEKKLKIEDAYQTAKALPATDSCANEQAYRDLLALETKYETEFYTDISKAKIASYGEKCVVQTIMKYSTDGKSARRKEQRNVFLGQLDNTYLSCKSPQITFYTLERSQPLYIVTGDYQDKTYGRRPTNEYKNDELLVRLARSEQSDLLRYETYQQSTVNGAIKDYSYGESKIELEKYSLGYWDLKRDSLKITRLETQEIEQYHSRIGDFTVTAFVSYELECQLLGESISNFADYVENRQGQFAKAKVAKEAREAAQREQQKRANDEAQEERNQI